MKPITKCFSMLLSSILLSSTASALPLAVTKAPDFTNSAGLLYTLNVSTSNGYPVRITGEGTYVGYDCNHLMLLYYGAGAKTLYPGTYPVDEGNFRGVVGEGWGCAQTNYVSGKKLYTTGPIQLHWNPGSRVYDGANPAQLNVLFFAS